MNSSHRSFFKTECNIFFYIHGMQKKTHILHKSAKIFSSTIILWCKNKNWYIKKKILLYIWCYSKYHYNLIFFSSIKKKSKNIWKVKDSQHSNTDIDKHRWLWCNQGQQINMINKTIDKWINKQKKKYFEIL